MKAACIVLAILVVVAIMAVCVMVKFATDITVEDKKLDDFPGHTVVKFAESMGVINLQENTSTFLAERFPYVAAVIRNSSASWSFACFASVILVRWIVTSAHCRRAGSTHRVLIYHDYIRNYTHTYPILFWRLHESFNVSSMIPRYDIAVAKLNIEFYPFSLKSSSFDEYQETSLVASIWKTVSTMDRRLFLTNDFDEIEVKIAPNSRCYESYGVFLDESMVCIDVSDYDDCFIHEFGPLYKLDKVVAIIAAKPRECELKWAIFTNISFYSNWILKSTSTTRFG